MSMSRLQRTVLLGAAAAALGAAACTETTAPPAVDPSAMATTVTGLNSSLAQNAVFQSLLALDTNGVFSVALARAAVRLAPAAPSAATAADTRRTLAALAVRAPTAVMALFPANVLDSTFIWDTAGGGHYRIDHTTGGPANGVRFVLYQVNDTTGQPRLPLQTTGYVDLIDVSSPQANAIHIVVQAAGNSAADYTVSEVRTTASLQLTAVGYVRDVLINGPQVSFNLSHLLTFADSSISTDYEASNGSASVSMLSTITGSGSSLNLTMDWKVTQGGSVEIVGVSGDTIDVKFKINDAVFAQVEGTPSNASVTTPTGQPLTSTQALALLTILDGFNSIYFNLSLVFVPGLLVFG